MYSIYLIPSLNLINKIFLSKKIVNNYFKKIMEDNQIGGYTIQAEAGTGGFCRVLGVSKKEDNRAFILKTLKKIIVKK